MAGSIAAIRLSANTTSGFSIVEYDGNSSVVATVGHGLSQAPELVIVKALESAYNWIVYSSELTSADYGLQLNENIAQTNTPDYWDNTDPTASVFTIGTDNGVNYLTNDYIAYCFHSVEGYSKIGAYRGNSNADGTFVYCGFRPAYILEKMFTTSGDWNIWDTARDTYNVAEKRLHADTNEAEMDGYTDLDILSNGFKFRRSSGTFNDSAQDCLYLAFAKYPFKYANAR